MAINLNTIEPQKILELVAKDQSNITIKQQGEIFTQSKGLFSHEVTFTEVKDVCEKYKLQDLLEGQDEKQLGVLTYQSMVNLQSLNSWSTILGHETSLSTLKEQAVLSSVLSAYAKKKLELGNTIQDTLKAKGIGFDMASEAMQAKENFKDVIATALEQAHVRENKYLLNLDEKIQGQLEKRKAGIRVLDPMITQSVTRQSHYCEAAFGQSLPTYAVNHLNEVIYAQTKLARQNNKELDPVTIQQLINYTLHHQSCVVSEKGISTSDDVSKMMQNHSSFYGQYNQSQRPAIESYLKGEVFIRKEDVKIDAVIEPLQAISSEKVKAFVKYSETYQMTNGLYEKLVSFNDIKSVCDRYELDDLI
jgi:hypothetical protein